MHCSKIILESDEAIYIASACICDVTMWNSTEMWLLFQKYI